MFSPKIIMYATTYILMSVIILSLSIKSTLDDTNSYIDNIFERINLTIQNVGQLNAQNVKEIQDIIDADLLANLRDSDKSDVEVKYYKQRNEFGFNQGLFPGTEAKGTLIGQGQPTPFIIGYLDHLIVLDRMWTFYNQRTIFNDHFLFNYKANYIYLSKKIKNLSDKPLYQQAFDTRLFLIQDIEKQEEEYGYFLSRPYIDVLSDEKTVSVLSPVFEDGVLVAHIGINITLSKLASTVSLYPEIKNKIDLDINFAYNNSNYTLSEGRYSYWPIITREYEISHFGKLVAVYDVSLVLTENISLFLLLLILGMLLGFNLYRRMQTQAKLREITEQINQDNLTGLYNRRGLEAILNNEIIEFKQTNVPVVLLAIDADKFKKINDDFGHLTGDLALKFIAYTMKKFTRDSDFLIRMGGDEFLIILVNSNLEQADIIVKRMDDYLENTSEEKIGARIKITHASTIFEPLETFDEAFQRVDELMYMKKNRL